MKKSILVLLFIVVLFGQLAVSANAVTVAIDATSTRDFHVVFAFSEINATAYANIQSNTLMTIDTLPTALYDNMVQKGLVRVEYYSPSISFNSTTRTIISAFNLRGPAIVNSSIDRGASIETFIMTTTWRKFILNVTTGFEFNFTRLLATPLASWSTATENGVTSFHYSNITDGVPISFSLKLPSYARNAAANGDTVTFDAPYTPSITDEFINSPLVILVALAGVGIIVYCYRKVR